MKGNMKNLPELKIGDRVWYAQQKTVSKDVVCPECLGQKALTVTLGDGSTVSIDCAGCALGYEPPRGYVSYWDHIADVCLVTIDRVEATADKIEYGFNGCYRADAENLFTTEEQANIRALELAEKWNKEQLDRINQKEKNNHTWSWHVHWHRSQIRKAKKDLEYNEAKLAVAKVKAKMPEET